MRTLNSRDVWLNCEVVAVYQCFNETCPVSAASEDARCETAQNIQATHQLRVYFQYFDGCFAVTGCV